MVCYEKRSLVRGHARGYSDRDRDHAFVSKVLRLAGVAIVAETLSSEEALYLIKKLEINKRASFISILIFSQSDFSR